VDDEEPEDSGPEEGGNEMEDMVVDVSLRDDLQAKREAGVGARGFAPISSSRSTSAMASSSGLRSPPNRSEASSPRPSFDVDLLKAYVKTLLAKTLEGASFPEAKERERVKYWIKEIGERVKERMVQIQPRGL
jgi:hypothetical protein